ncbi:MAG: type I restriction enzyme HsdR N-terminal domain-containing protein [Vicinamibacterales bacterium]
MATLPKKAVERISSGLKRFQPILQSAKSRDVNESDTVVMVTDLLQDVFGYDKYLEITSEHMIRSTFCDLAVKLDGALAFLIEVKAIGLDPKEQFVRQAVDYAANQGVDWVVLTTGTSWKVYKVAFTKPIAHELVVEFDLLTMNPRNAEHIERLGLLAKEGWQKARLGDYHSQRQALSRFTLGALVLSDPILDVLRREVRRLSPDARIASEDIKAALETDVLKREVLEGEKADSAKRMVARASGRSLRASKSAAARAELDSAEAVTSAEG